MLKSKFLWSLGLGSALTMFAAQSADAGSPCNACGPAPAPCGNCAPTTVERTVMVPVCVTEKRKVVRTHYRTEQRTKTYTEYRQVPKQEKVTRTCTVMVPKVETRTVTHRVCKPVYHDETVETTVCVPHQEKRTGMRPVTRCVPVAMTRTICVDEGHWEERVAAANPCGNPCGGCNPCGNPCGGCAKPCVTKVWVAKPVQKQVNYTVNKVVCEQQPFEYTVCVMKPEKRTTTVKRCVPTWEDQTQQVQCTVMVPQQRTYEETITRCECVATPRTQTYNVCVPFQVEEEVEVRVRRCVPKTITVQVNSSCGGCKPCCS